MYCSLSLFFFNDTATTEIYTLSLHDALPIYSPALLIAMAAIVLAVFWLSFREQAKHSLVVRIAFGMKAKRRLAQSRSEEHTSELQSLAYLVCRLLLEKKKKYTRTSATLYHSS